MKILSIDTSGSSLNVGLLDSSTGLFFTHDHSDDQARTHSMKILPAIQQLMAQASWSFQDLDRLALTAGPGSFTGLRIGATVAKMIAGQIGAELVPVSTLYMIAASAPLQEHAYIPMINARNRNVFAAVYQPKQPLREEKHWPFSTLLTQVPADSVFVFQKDTGDEFKLDIEKAGFRFIERKADDLINTKLLAEAGLKLPVVDAAAFVPHYLRKTAAEMHWLAAHPDADDGDYAKYVSEV